MKQILTFLLALNFSFSFAQTTAIPDSIFEQKLIDLGLDTGAIDGYVATANINTIISLNVFNDTIIDLTGIEDFTALEVLNCYFNQITSLDLSQNINLKELRCNNTPVK